MPNEPGLSRRWFLTLIGVGVLIAAAGAALMMRRPAPLTTAPDAAAAPAAVASSDYVNDRLRREIITKGLTVDVARQLFALEVTSLPGVTAPPGEVRPTFSGTYAMTQLQAVRTQLTPEQRARLDELLDDKRSNFPRGFPKLAAPFSRPPFVLPTIQPAVFRADTMPGLRRIALPDVDAENEAAYRAYFQQLYHWANGAVAQLTGLPPVPAFLISFESLDGKDWVLSGSWKGDEPRQAMVKNVPVPACLTRIDVRKFQGDIDVHLSVVTHEVVHCYQQLNSASAADVAGTHPWLHDGEATWVQMVIVPGAAAEPLRRHWTEYLLAPTQHLYNRSYDAAGFFGLVASAVEGGRDLVGKRLISAFIAGASFRNDAAYNTLVAGVEERVLDAWAPSYFRTHESLQSPVRWTVTEPGAVNIPSEKATPVVQSVANGDTIDLHAAAPWELSLVTLQSNADLVVVTPTEGHVAVVDRSDQVNKVVAVGELLVLCLLGDCSCPPGTEGQVAKSIPAQSPIDIALTGGRPGATGWAHGIKRDDFCDPKKQTYAPSGALPHQYGGGGVGGEPVNGTMKSDPHLVTFDGRWYDLQALGEFTLARSTVDDFAVQVRLGTIGALRTVSVATAMATHVGRDRVIVSIDKVGASPVVLHINGKLADQDFVRLDGGSIRTVFNEAGTGYVTEFDDGTRVGISPFARQGLNVWIVPSPARKGRLTGLLGDFDGSDANEPVIRGTADVLPADPSHDDLYGKFANSWRITAAESLLDYAADQSTATFTDANFPDRSPIADPATVAAAETACRERGISQANLLKNCTTDFAATGNREIIRAYQPQQRRVDLAAARGVSLTGTGVVTPNLAPMRTRAVLFDGRVTDANADAAESFQGNKGDVLYLDPTNCLKPRFMRILGPDQKPIAGLGPPCGVRLDLPADGTYSVVMNPFHDFAGAYHLAFVPVRPDRVTKITIGDVLTGTLTMRAEHDVFLLDAKSPGAITIGGGDCAAEVEIAVFFGDAESITAGPACRMGQITLPRAGTYRIVINPFSTATGSYRVPTR